VASIVFIHGLIHVVTRTVLYEPQPIFTTLKKKLDSLQKYSQKLYMHLVNQEVNA